MYQFRNLAGEDSEAISAATLLALVQTGVVTEETLVRPAHDGKWQPAWRIVDLQGAFGLVQPSPALVSGPPRHPSAQAEWVPITVPRRSIKPPAAILILIGVVLTVLFVPLVRGMSGPRVVATRDGRMELTLPAGWRSKTPDPDLELMAERDGGQAVLLVGSVEIEPDEPMMSLEAFDFNRVQGTIRDSDDFQDLGKQRYEANGLEFFGHEFRAKVRGRDGIHTVVTTRTHGAFYRLVITTAPGRSAALKQDLQAILMSIRKK